MADYNQLETVLNNRYADDTPYLADGMQQFTVKKLDGTNPVTYTGYGTYTFVWEKSYVKSPIRSNDGTMGNLDTYPTFKTPHLIVTYSVMTIDDYREMMKQYLDGGNEFIVNCYDPIYKDKTKSYRMYFATPSAPNYYTIVREDGSGVDLIGVRDYTVELIGTNNK